MNRNQSLTREFRIEMRNSLVSYSVQVYNNVNICIRRSIIMIISYNKLWKLLVDRKMSKADLRKAAGIAPNMMTRLRRDEEVILTVLYKKYVWPLKWILEISWNSCPTIRRAKKGTLISCLLWNMSARCFLSGYSLRTRERFDRIICYERMTKKTFSDWVIFA